MRRTVIHLCGMSDIPKNIHNRAMHSFIHMDAKLFDCSLEGGQQADLPHRDLMKLLLCTGPPTDSCSN